MLSSEPIFRIHAELGEIMELGATPYGGRRLIPILGGRGGGAQLQGGSLPRGRARGGGAGPARGGGGARGAAIISGPSCASKPAIRRLPGSTRSLRLRAAN